MALVFNSNALPVEQLLYTSFPKVGFRVIASPSVAISVQEFFVQQIVYRYWDAYSPPPEGLRAIFLHQIERHQFLFGWIYNDGKDDMGRSHIPYFLGYYLQREIGWRQLERVLAILEKGPIDAFDRRQPPPVLDTLHLGNASYSAGRSGVAIPPPDCQLLRQNLQQGQFLDFYLPCSRPPRALNATPDSPRYPVQPLIQRTSTRTSTTMMDRIEQILADLTDKPIGIQGIVLVSDEGQPITPPIGLDENMVQIAAGTMLYLAKSSERECKWSEIDHITVRAPEGHLILSRCQDGRFLLVKAGKALIGLLEGEINRTIQRLDEVFQNAGAIDVQRTIPEASISPNNFSDLKTYSDSAHTPVNTYSENTYSNVEAIAPDPESDEIVYRGRPAR